MALAIDRPDRRRRFIFGRNRGVAPAPAVAAETRTEARVRPLGAGGVGFWTVLLAAWAGIVVFVGPLFGYHPTSGSAWDWTTQNWLLHALPGAVGVAAGLMMLGTIGARGAGRRGGLGLASLLTMAAGAWLVVGPAAYRMIESGSPYAQPASTNSDFLHQIGANLGPGVLLLILAGMALKAGIANPRVVYEPVGQPAAPAAAAPVAAGSTRRPTVEERPTETIEGRPVETSSNDGAEV